MEEAFLVNHGSLQ